MFDDSSVNANGHYNLLLLWKFFRWQWLYLVPLTELSHSFFVEATMLNSKNFILRILLEIPHRQKKFWQLTVQHANLIKMHLKLLLEFKVYNFSYHCSEICATDPHEIYPYMKILEKFWTQRDVFIVCNQFLNFIIQNRNWKIFPTVIVCFRNELPNFWTVWYCNSKKVIKRSKRDPFWLDLGKM